jgi:hypothetical protein
MQKGETNKTVSLRYHIDNLSHWILPAFVKLLCISIVGNNGVVLERRMDFHKATIE